MYDSGIPEYPIFQPTLNYSVAVFSILVCMVQEATRLSPRNTHLHRDRSLCKCTLCKCTVKLYNIVLQRNALV